MWETVIDGIKRVVKKIVGEIKCNMQKDKQT